MSDSTRRRLVAFDFDGTLTCKETLSRFFFLGLPWLGVIRGCLRWIPALLRHWLVHPSRDHFKQACLTAFLKGYSRESLERWGRSYAQSYLPHYLREETWRRLLEESRSSETWIVSGSLSLYLKPFFQPYPLQGILCCELAYDDQGLCLGRLCGENCWGDEKLKRLEKATSLHPSWLVVYGNSLGDQALLDAAWESHWL